MQLYYLCPKAKWKKYDVVWDLALFIESAARAMFLYWDVEVCPSS